MKTGSKANPASSCEAAITPIAASAASHSRQLGGPFSTEARFEYRQRSGVKSVTWIITFCAAAEREPCSKDYWSQPIYCSSFGTAAKAMKRRQTGTNPSRAVLSHVASSRFRKSSLTNHVHVSIPIMSRHLTSLSGMVETRRLQAKIRFVMPAQAGIYLRARCTAKQNLDSGLRRNDDTEE